MSGNGIIVGEGMVRSGFNVKLWIVRAYAVSAAVLAMILSVFNF